MRPEFIVLRCRLLFPWSARFPSALLALLLLAVLDCRVRPPASQAAWTFLPLERRIYRVTADARGVDGVRLGCWELVVVVVGWHCRGLK